MIITHLLSRLLAHVLWCIALYGNATSTYSLVEAESIFDLHVEGEGHCNSQNLRS
jgi:hypothetical protein